ncbi:hypothetical protein M408DRAFT_158678 [Serendipita vermifera MAFF 305830]|uniref:Zinc finger PHD-type domain-containing protein n=1 Tax=Serendipita vermifera MAFF 305830 TaxID=933852 RepID=A0A0C3BQH5_SERVB|nr:hypothetical protein M408DRAFT_158678 [Serendipita vermifera MAFF 305830]
MDVVPAPTEPTVDVPKIEDNYDELLKQLRREWKWAAASDFLYKFNAMLHLDFLDLADVEHDLIRGTSETIMSVFIKILHVLTSIRGLAPDTWETYLRRLYARRVPENRVWGTEEEPIAWAELGFMNRLDILHDLCEWQFQNPLRVRQSMKDDSDDASWRSSPIGKDSKRNEYWHLGRDRLWIRRSVAPPEVPKVDLKRKKHPTKGAQQPAKRKAPQKAAAKPAPSKSKAKPRETQSKPTKAQSKQTNGTNGARMGSRVSRRGGTDGWQKVPDEWLKDTTGSNSQGKKKQTPDAKEVEALFDADSDLTDLSDHEKPEDAKTKGTTGATSDSDSDLTDIDDEDESEDEEEKNGSTEPNGDVKMEVDPRDDPNFVEFETICVTMNEWKEFAEKFKSVKSHNERRLYRYITMVVIPEMEEHQRAIEEKEKKELKEMLKREQAAAAALAAESRPKRSSRLAALADDDDKKNDSSSMDGDTDSRWGSRATRTRRAAMRGTRWQEEQEERVAALDASEGDDGEDQDEADDAERQAKRRNKSDQDEYQDEDSEDAQPPSTPNTVEINTRGRPRRAAAVKADQMRPVKPTRRRRNRSDSEEGVESDEPFFLNCDICKKSGWNEDDGQHLISCKECGIWQHMMCHDRADRLEGKPKRNWTEEQLLCASCTAKAQNKRPRRGKKPKDAVATDGEDVVMDAPNTQTTNDTAMDISSTNDAVLQHDPAQPSTEHVGVEQPAPPFSNQQSTQVSSTPLNGTSEQYSETLAQAQRTLASVALENPTQQPVLQAAQQAPIPKQYSSELALAQKVVASGMLNDAPTSIPSNGPAQAPEQWSSTGYGTAPNGVSMNGLSYPAPPS